MASKDISDQLKDLALEDVIPQNKELGRGAYGKVFTVDHLGLPCAAKEIHSLLIDGVSPEEKKAIKDGFIRECYHSSLIRHPNIVQFMGVYYAKPSDVYSDPRTDLPIMVMELMDTSLTSFIKDNQSKIAIKTKLSILHDVSLGLSHLHGRRPAVIHRDLSSNNVLISGRGNLVAKISDLGTAKMIRADSKKTKRRLTTAPGTLHFMPPEALDEKDPVYGTPVDVFSFGGITLHLFSEEWPTPSGHKKRDPNTKKMISLSEVERRQQYLDTMTMEAAVLKDMVMRCLDDDPDERPPIQEVSKMIKSLKQHIEEPVKKDVTYTIKEEKPAIDSQILKLPVHPEVARKVFKESRIKLMTSLPMDDVIFLELLRRRDLFSGDLQEQVQAKDTKAAKTAWFLDHTIKPSLEADITKPLHDLLTVMSDDEYTKSAFLKALAAEIQQQLDKDTSHSGVQAVDPEESKEVSKNIRGINSEVAANQLQMSSQVQSSTKEIPPFAEALQSGNYHIKWTTCSDLPTPMYVAHVAVSNGTIYCTGTCPNDDNDNNVYCYDTNQWKQLPRPGHRRGVIHMVDDKLTIFGGRDSTTDEFHNKVTTYNGKTNSWYSCYPDMLHNRYRPGVITSDDHVIVMGGKSSKDTTLDSIEVMNYNHQLQWKEVSVRLPVPMWAIKPIISGEYITIVGYCSDLRYTTTYQITTQEIISSLDQPLSTGAVTREWKELSSTTHWDTATVPYSNPPVIIGGGDKNSIPTSDVSLYDSSKNSWRKVDSLTSARNNVGISRPNDHTIIVVGGCSGGEGVEGAMVSCLTTVEIGNIVSNQ